MRSIELVVYPDFTAMSLAAATVFETANLKLQAKFYEIELVSEFGGLVRSSMGADVSTAPFSLREKDTLIISGADRLVPHSSRFLNFVKSAPSRFDRIAGLCTGAFALAEAGLLDGKRATTHWYFAPEFRKLYKNVRMDEDRIFVEDDRVWTSAGMSAGSDMALAMVERDLGIEVAKSVSKILVMYNRRSGGQLQFSTLLDLDPQSDRLQQALTYAAANLASNLTVEHLAKVANLSARQFSRAFRAETGQSPAKAVERMRVEAARQMLEDGRHPLNEIARRTGFNDRERMRKAFIDWLGQPPQAIRRAVRFDL